MHEASEGPRILLVVTGGIAAYKTPQLVHLLREDGASVRVAMTKNATRFIGARSLEAASDGPVLLDLFADDDGQIDHVAWGTWAKLLLVAPATANFLAKMAHGLADDAASTLMLACRAKVLVAPAMNDAMWEHPATIENCQTLRTRGVRFCGPEEGELAEGHHAIGRMAEPATLAEAARALL